MDIYGKRIFISSCGGLGDLLVCTPALRRLKEKYSCHITFLCQKKYEAAIRGLDYIDKVVTIERGKFLGRYRCIFTGKLYAQDCLVFTDWHPILLLFAHWFRVPVIAGVANGGEHKFLKYLTKRICNHVFDQTYYAALSNAMTYSEALDIDLDGDMSNIEISEPGADDCSKAKEMLAAIGCEEQKYILLAPFTSLSLRDWPVDTAREFVNRAEEKYGMPVVVIGTDNNKSAAEQISRYSLTGGTTVLQMAQLIKWAKAVVAMDSGPMHVAGAVGTPLVALFSRDLPSKWAPRKNCKVIYTEYPCSPCSIDMVKKCQKNIACVKDISSDMVLNKLDEFFVSRINF